MSINFQQIKTSIQILQILGYNPSLTVLEHFSVTLQMSLKKIFGFQKLIFYDYLFLAKMLRRNFSFFLAISKIFFKQNNFYKRKIYRD